MGKYSQVISRVPWVVLGAKSFAADKGFKVIMLYLEIKDVFNFPLILSFDVDMLASCLSDLYNQVQLVLT